MASFFEERKKDIVDSLLKRPNKKSLQINVRIFKFYEISPQGRNDI